MGIGMGAELLDGKFGFEAGFAPMSPIHDASPQCTDATKRQTLVPESTAYMNKASE